MLQLHSDILLFILQVFSYLISEEELYIYFKNSSGITQKYLFVAKQDNMFLFFPKPDFRILIDASILKYILPPSTSMVNIFVDLGKYSGYIYFGDEEDLEVLNNLNKIIQVRLEYLNFLNIHNNLYNAIFHTNKKDTEKDFKKFIKNLHKERYDFLLESKKNLEKVIDEGKTILENPYLDMDKSLVKEVRERYKRRLKFVNDAIREVEKVNVEKKIPENLIIKLESQDCMDIENIREYTIVDTLIFGGCEKYGYPTRTLKYAWEDLEKIIMKIREDIDNPNIPDAVLIYDELVNRVKTCYYVKNASNFIVDFYRLGSCNCQCGTYMLYHLFKMYPDSMLNIFVRLEEGHIKVFGINQNMASFIMETTNVSEYFKYNEESIVNNTVECFIYSPFVLSCAYIQFDITNTINTIFERVLDLPQWDDKYNRDLESYFSHLSLKGINTLVDVDALFILTLYNIIKYNHNFDTLLGIYAERIRDHFIPDIEKIVRGEIQTEEMLYTRKRENIEIFTKLKGEKRRLMIPPYKDSGEEMIENEIFRKPKEEGDLKAKLQEKKRKKRIN